MKSQATKILQSEYKNIFKTPVEGFKISLVDDSDMFQWKVALFGPPDTLYAGGYFRAILKFPQDYPYSPPAFRFITKMFHSNIYENGEVCISILHSPINDPQSGELPSERWNPTQNVRTILLSVISLLNEPNTSSPANVDASVMFRRWKDSKGVDKEYKTIIIRQVKKSQEDAKKDNVTIPTTLDEYCIKTQINNPTDDEDNFDWDPYDDEDDDEDMESDED